MKKTLGIFGDSYADDKNYHYSEGHGRIVSKWEWLPHIGPSYIEMLEADFEIHRHAKCGSSLYYSLQLFEELYDRYDHVFFVVTEPGRFEVNQYQYNFPEDNRVIYGPNATRVIRNFHKDRLTINDIKFLDVLDEFYFPYMFKHKQQQFEHQIMKKRIKELRPDAFVIDAFGDDDNNLLWVQNYEMKCWQVPSNELSGNYNDMRKCHMTQVNHVVFYNALKNYFANDVKFEIKDLSWQRPEKPLAFYRSVFS